MYYYIALGQKVESSYFTRVTLNNVSDYGTISDP